VDCLASGGEETDAHMLDRRRSSTYLDANNKYMFVCRIYRTNRFSLSTFY
jgi:hypothetical protein